MNPLTVTNRVRVGLLLLVALLSGIIAVELYFSNADPAAPDSVVVRDDALPTRSDARFVPPDIDGYVTVLERPLFFQDRRLPAEPEPEVVAVAPPQPLRLTLEGVAISSDSRVAVLRMTSGNQLVQLAEGMSHDGWLLESVSADRAIFKRGTQVTELLLDATGRTGQR